MGSKPSVSIDYAILCDEIRQEDNGKLLVIGMYTGDILIGNFPGTLPLTILLHGQSDADCSVPIEIRFTVEFEDDKPFTASAGGDLNIKGTAQRKEFFTPLPKVPIEFRDKGRLLIDYRIDKKRWRRLIDKRVDQCEAPSK